MITDLLLVCKYFLWPCWEPAGPALGGDSSHSAGQREAWTACQGTWLGVGEDGLAQSQKATPAQLLMSPDPTSWSVPSPTPTPPKAA